MTNEQINAAVAEACGWHSITTTGIHGMKGPLRGYMQIPDYCTDLNAMHEAEGTLNEDQLWQMAREIEKNWEDQWYFRATAHQRAEAFLKTLGKWEEVQK